MRRVIAGITHLPAAGADDAGQPRILPPFLPLDEIAVREFVDTLVSGTTHACTCQFGEAKALDRQVQEW